MLSFSGNCSNVIYIHKELILLVISAKTSGNASPGTSLIRGFSGIRGPPVDLLHTLVGEEGRQGGFGCLCFQCGGHIAGHLWRRLQGLLLCLSACRESQNLNLHDKSISLQPLIAAMAPTPPIAVISPMSPNLQMKADSGFYQ